MQKRAPTLGNLIVIAVFVLSCFGLLLFLWESFGGPVPLKAKGYRVTVSFPQALQLAEEADVRISGVPVGHVVSFKLGRDDHTDVLLEINHQYAPLRANMHAMLRQKTLLGETYVQLIPKDNSGPFLADKGHLAESQVEPSVTLDDILSTFTPKARHAWQVWMQASAKSFEGRGENINADFAALPPFVGDTNKLIGILATQEGALRDVIKNTGVVFGALAGRDHQLEGLIANGDRTFKAAASASEAFAAAFRTFPSFESKSRVAFKELDSFAADASPFLDQFRSVERQLAPTAQELKRFAPPFERMLVGLGRLTSASREGLPAFSKALKLLEPELANLPPVLHNLDPFLQYLGKYQAELQSFFGNFTAASEGRLGNANDKAAPIIHYLRTMQVFNTDNLAVLNERIGTDRGNAYPQPEAFNLLANGGLQVFSSSNCANSAPSVNGPPNETVSEQTIQELMGYVFEKNPKGEYVKGQRTGPRVANESGTPNEVPAPACSQQGPLTFNGQSSQYPHVVGK
jgi:virulence factor Mce-like protein